jgi:hypothetical protein
MASIQVEKQYGEAKRAVISGLRAYGRLNDYPAGHFRAWMTKAL